MKNGDMTQGQNDSRVLYLTYDGLTDPLGQAQILPYLTNLALEGYKISIVSFEKKINIHLQSGIQTVCFKHGIEWCPLVYHKRPRIVSTIFDLWHAWRVASSLIRKHRFQIVHCRSYLMAMVGLRTKRKFNVPFIFDMRGFWTDERLDGGLWTLQNPIDRLMYRFFKRQERILLQEADRIVCLTEKAAQVIAEWGSYGSVTVIPCCVDENLFNPGKVDRTRRDQLMEKLGLRGRFVVLYLGSVGTWYMLNEMIDFFQVVNRRIPSATFLIVSNDPPTTISRVVEAKGVDLKNVVVTRSKRSEVPLFLSLADFSIFFIKPKFSKQASSPTKLAESLSMGVPVITNSGVGDIDNLFSENNFGLLIDRFAESEYEHAVDLMMRYKPAADLSAVAGQKFSLSSGVALYEEVYRSLLPDKGHIQTSLDHGTPKK